MVANLPFVSNPSPKFQLESISDGKIETAAVGFQSNGAGRMRLYVGNLPWSATEESVRTTFEAIGAVESVALITDRETGRSRGFAFVEMADDLARKAMQELDGQDMDGRNLRINEAQERQERRPRY